MKTVRRRKVPCPYGRVVSESPHAEQLGSLGNPAAMSVEPSIRRFAAEAFGSLFQAFNVQNSQMREKLAEFDSTTQALNAQFEEQLELLNEQHQALLDDQKGTLEVILIINMCSSCAARSVSGSGGWFAEPSID
eukprot:1187869-Prorocentrum_minimum.AAC.2